MARRRGRSVGEVTRYTGAATRPPSFNDRYEDEPITSGTTFFLVVTLAFVVLCFLAVRFGTSNIESDLQARSLAALRAEGYSGVEVEASATTIRITGIYLEGQSDEGAKAIIAGVSGVSGVEGQIWAAPVDELDQAPTKGAPLEIRWEAGTVTVTGNVATEEDLTSIRALLGGIAAEADSWLLLPEDEPAQEAALSTMLEGVSVLEGLEDQSAWLGSVLALLRVVPPDVPVGMLRADGGNRYLVVSGEVLEKSVRDTLNTRIQETADALGFDANPAIRVLDEGPTVEEVEDLQDDLNDLILDQVVEFEVDSFALTAKGRSLLDEVLDALAGAPDDIRIEIAGHTDDAGSEAENLILSERRAQAVLDYLVTNGQDPARFEIIGYGESSPIASNDTEEGRARNRRIEFTALFEEAP